MTSFAVIIFSLVSLLLLWGCNSFSVPDITNSLRPSKTPSLQLWAVTPCDGNDHHLTKLLAGSAVSRRTAIGALGLSSLWTIRLAVSQPALAKTSPQDEADKLKIAKGYQRLSYLLDNWVQETTQCGVSDNPYVSAGGCERTPLKVMDYLGYRNINDPLFKAEKTMRRLENLVPSDRQIEYLEAIEQWVEAADEGSGMAYISSWGEANPGGGKDRVALFIERARKNVIDSRDSLATVMEILDISEIK